MKKAKELFVTIKEIGLVLGKNFGRIFLIGVGFLGLVSWTNEFFKDTDD